MLFRFVAGNNYKHALNYSKQFLKGGTIPIINYITENNKNDFKKVLNEYTNLLNYIDNSYMIALKLSSLNFNKQAAYSIADICKEKNIKLIIDAEEDKNIEKYRNIVNYMIRKYNNSFNNFTIIKTYQMYRKDSLMELYDDLKYFDNCNCIFSSKLVRGAYYNSEYKDGHLFTKKEDTDNSYDLGIIKCEEYKSINNIIASHNIKSLTLANDLNKYNNKFIIANLMGMNQHYMNNLNMKKAIYIPYGPYKEMIPYLSRRLYENIDSIKYMYT